jgi:hypothetical protein
LALTLPAVAAALAAADISTVTAAEQTGIPRSTLSRRLTGNSPFTLVELELIESLLGVGVGHFVSVSAAA